MAKPAKHYPDMADPQARPRHTGIPTFFRTLIAEDFAGVDIGIVGVPFDGGVTHRSGTRHGPRAVREQSALLRRYNGATGIAPFELCRVRDLGDCWIERPYALETAHAEIEAYFDELAAAGVTPLAVGGDHSITLPILRAIGSAGLGLLHIDAHGDTGGDYMGSDQHHGSPFSRAVEARLLDPARCVSIGIRGTVNDRTLAAFPDAHGMRVIPMDEVFTHGWRAAADEARRVLGDGPVYLSFDIDSLDPSEAPGTGTPEAGGLRMIEALHLLRAMRGVDVIGADLVEVSPPWDNGTLTSFNGASVLFELLCLLAEARVFPKLTAGPQ